MATYTEIFGLGNNSDLINKVIVACIVAAEGIMGESDTTENHAERIVWAATVFRNREAIASAMYEAVLAANKDNTVDQIKGASDEAIQSQVNDHVDLFAVNL